VQQSKIKNLSSLCFEPLTTPETKKGGESNEKNKIQIYQTF
jgi:hypothetical protein